MGIVNLDPALKAKLNGLNEKMMLVDDRGVPIGGFLPVEDFRRFMLSAMQIPFTADEIAQFRSEKGSGISLKEFWAKMAKEHGEVQ